MRDEDYAFLILVVNFGLKLSRLNGGGLQLVLMTLGALYPDFVG